jgi:signal transduction histidine kinase/ligand-binding sensor domain-containing protein
LRISAIALALAVIAAPVRAWARPTYALTAWTTEKGLPPGDIVTMAEDRAGDLWLGMSTGLVRFDGAQFASWSASGERLPGTQVTALIGAGDGGLWVGFGDAGGVARVRDGRILHYYAADDGLPKCIVTAMLEDRHGAIWAGCQRGLAMFDGHQWQFVGADRSLPAGASISALYEDRRGVLWVAAATGVYRRRVNQDAFEQVDRTATYAQSLTDDDGGALWVADSHRIARRLDRPEPLVLGADVRLPSAGWRILHDQRDAIWIAALGSGLLRLDRDGASRKVERISYESMITGSPRALFEDHENNIWVSMRGGGLLRVSESAVATGVALDGLTNDGVRAMATAPDGSIWVATGHSLNRFSGAARSVYSLPQTLALHVDRQGTLWAVTAEALGKFVDGRLQPMPLPSDVRIERAAALTTDFSSNVWLCTLEQGMYVSSHGVFTPLAGSPEVAGRGCSYTFTDARGRVWIGFARGGAAYFDGQLHLLGEKDGLAAGGVLVIAEDAGGDIWFGTTTGVSRFSGGRFATVAMDESLSGKLISALVGDSEGQMWLGAYSGAAIVKFSRRDFDGFSDRLRRELQYSVYDASDGLQGSTHWASRPSLARDKDGRLWFATGTGIVIIDPRRPPSVRRPGAPRVERIMTDGRTLDLSAPMTLPHASSITVAYSAVSLSSGSKIRFRYALEGLTNGWIEAGAARTASFEHLPAGRYRFRVAATTDGTWIERDAAWDFIVRSPFYQTIWFYAMLSALALLAAWAYWQLRLRAIRNQFALVVAERARVGREIHDTLLQSLGAVGVELEVVASQLRSTEAPASAALTRLRRDVSRCIREARESIWELRTSRLEMRDLAAALEDLADDVGTARAVEVDVEAHGRPRHESPEADEQLLRIAQEAIGNAVRHGRPKRVQVSLDYQRDTVSLRVADDGCGFVASEHRPDGEHWGLTTMKERAERIGGRLTITSGPGLGTVVETVVPMSGGA